MERLVIKSGHKITHITIRLKYVLNFEFIDTHVGFTFNRIGVWSL